MDANILLHCVGERATLENAFDITTNWENTLAHMNRQTGIMTTGVQSNLMATMRGLPTRAQTDHADLGAMLGPTLAYSSLRQKDFEDIRNQLKLHGMKIGSLETSFRDIGDIVMSNHEGIG